MSASLETVSRQRVRKDARLELNLTTDLKQRVEIFASQREMSVAALVRSALVREMAGAA